MASSGGAARLSEAETEGNTHTAGRQPPASWTSIGSRRALLAGGGSARGVEEKRAGIHARSGKVNGGGLRNRAAGCGGGTHQPTAAGRQAISPFRPSPRLPPPLGFSLSARWRDGGVCCDAASRSSCLLYLPLWFCLILHGDSGYRSLFLSASRPIFSLEEERGAGEEASAAAGLAC